MINKYRYLDILLFYVKISFFIGDKEIKQGWNQLIRKENEYCVRILSEDIFYVNFPVKQGYELLENTFGGLYD